MWKKSYEEKKLGEIIFEDLKQQMDPSSLETFSNIAYRCLKKYREERPNMSSVVKELEVALHIQKTEGPVDYEEMSENARNMPFYRFEEAAFFTQKTFSLTCTSKMLSPYTRYACYLVYKIKTKNSNVGQVVEVSDHGWITKSAKYDPRCILLFLPETPFIRQKTTDNTHSPLKKTKMNGVPQRRNDGWLEVQVWKCKTGSTTSERTFLDLYLNLKSFSRITELMVQGIEFKAISIYDRE
ncbi:hypothetical protein L1887_40185 [Cichorium endivia]|nr:hypothetical protein L1887_40185 [Cichorium endivia]